MMKRTLSAKTGRASPNPQASASTNHSSIPVTRSRKPSSNLGRLPPNHVRTLSTPSVKSSISSSTSASTASTAASSIPSSSASVFHHPTASSTPLESPIQVSIRCRSRSPLELSLSSPVILSIPSSSSLSIHPPSSTVPKTYTFDSVLGPEVEQVEVYDKLVRPLVEEVLEGWSATVFAYGQTGTGKTYTMTGNLPELPTPPTPSTSFCYSASDPIEILPSSGIIPRVLSHMFSSLNTSKSEFTVRVSFLEIYNEELRDLNHPAGSTMTGTSGDKQLRIFEDPKKKGSVVVQGLEETLIGSEAEGLKILKKGLDARQTTATNCNTHSSRSHTIFSLTIHLSSKSDSTGEQLLKVGKLNLVDLAGSENVGRSGVEKGIRTREAGMINQSLLTLGRVIAALVEGGHVPYRESKLTRLLSPSLGGSTRTLLLSTISPSLSNLEETLSTLDYSMRAKSIKNRPERNERMKKNELLSSYAMEIERLKVELWNQREKAGIYISQERWEELTGVEENLKNEVEELKIKMIGLEDVVRVKERKEKDLTVEIEERKKEVEREREGRKEEERKREEKEKEVEKWKEELSGVWEKLERKSTVESSNLSSLSNISTTLTSSTETLTSLLTSLKSTQSKHLEHISNELIASIQSWTISLGAVKEGLVGFEAEEREKGIWKEVVEEVVKGVQERMKQREKKVEENMEETFKLISELIEFMETSSEAKISQLESLHSHSIRSLTSQLEHLKSQNQLLTSLISSRREARSNLKQRLIGLMDEYEAEEESKVAKEVQMMLESVRGMEVEGERGTGEGIRMIEGVMEEVGRYNGEVRAKRARLQERQEGDRVEFEDAFRAERALLDQGFDRVSDRFESMEVDLDRGDEKLKQLDELCISKSEAIGSIGAVMKSTLEEVTTISSTTLATTSPLYTEINTNLGSLSALAKQVSSSMSKDLPTGKTPKRPVSGLSPIEDGYELTVIKEENEEHSITPVAKRTRSSLAGVKRRFEDVSGDLSVGSTSGSGEGLLKGNERILNGIGVTVGVRKGRI